MTNVFLVSYDLKDPDGDYSGVFDILKGSKHWWHYLESTWLVVTDGPPSRLWSRLEPHVRSDDRLLIIGVNAESEGLLPKKAWNWIKRNVDQVVGQAE